MKRFSMFVIENMTPTKKIFLFIVMAFALTASASNPIDKYIEKMRYYRYTKYLDSTKFYFKSRTRMSQVLF